ncbi:BCCT family transporter [Amycolatopsis palatopharyngis]|uniref:BCCT family transporter n=1 Tax=Amycolatopsis palatopharyngis TaxID=187982 RepID=UPI000E24068A|nr:BCCT family transporter [Amycolatopsis palatopharyngis]
MSKGENSQGKGWRSGIDLPVTIVAATLALGFLAIGLIFSDQLRIAGLHVYAFIADWFGWVFVLATAGFVFFILYLAFSRFGKIKLGKAEDKPEYSTFSWISMMFALGVGIGLIFYGAYEPVLLYAEPPPGGPAPRTEEAAVVGMQYSIFHWALHPWAFFGVAGLTFAYSTMNKGRSSLVTSTLRPLLGNHADGGVGRSIDTWVIVTTLVGNAVTLGLGTLQIIAGLGFVGGIKSSTLLLVLVVGSLTIAFVFSAVAGVDRGIKRLADFNVLLAIGLMLFLLLLGPFKFILDLLSEALGGYLFNFLPMSFETGAFDDGTWMQNWTIFFWAWGISWAPYVGSFLAKISRGRTIREYVVGVLIAPSLATVVWFSVLGGTSLDLQISGQVDVAAAAGESAQAALFEVLQAFPLATVTSIAVIILAAVFFVSGADAGAIVLGTFSSKGNPEPKKWLTVGWGLLVGMVALMLLIVGGLDALQWGAIVVASPFVLVLIAMCVGFVKDLRGDVKSGQVDVRRRRSRV